jgi:hypothetical protein
VDNPLEEAFNWLVVILGIVAGALSQFPELWPLQIHGVTRPVFLVRILILPVIVLVLIWLWSYLAKEKEHQVVLKSLSWVLATILMIADIVFIILGTYGLDPNTLTGPGENFLQWIIYVLLILSPFYLAPPFCLFGVRPRMREIHKNSKFLYSLPKQALLYIIAVLLYLTASGVIIFLA